MPLPEKPDMVPPVNTTSDDVKSALDSLSEKVSAAVSPAFKLALSLVMAMVGSVMS